MNWLFGNFGHKAKRERKRERERLRQLERGPQEAARNRPLAQEPGGRSRRPRESSMPFDMDPFHSRYEPLTNQDRRGRRREIPESPPRQHERRGRSRHVRFDEQPRRVVQEYRPTRPRQRFESPGFGLEALNLGGDQREVPRRRDSVRERQEPQRQQGPAQNVQSHHGMRERRGFEPSKFERVHHDPPPARFMQFGLGNHGMKHRPEAEVQSPEYNRPRRLSQAPPQQTRSPAAASMFRGLFGHNNGRSNPLRSNAPRNDDIRRKYEKVESLAAGGMSTAVNVVRDRSNGKLFVQKCVDVGGDPARVRRFRAELDTLKRIRASGGSKYLNLLIENDTPPSAMLILEYCEKGSVRDLIEDKIRDRSGRVKEVKILNILLDMGRALAFLHEGRDRRGRPVPNWDRVAHLDIKPDNILLSLEGGIYGHPRAVLADFGCAVKFSEILRGREHPYLQQYGTPAWYPPEGLMGAPNPQYGPTTDIWQLGATIHAVCMLLPRQPNRNILGTPMPCGPYYSPSMNRAVAYLCQYDPASRPGPFEIAMRAAVDFESAAQRDRRN